MASTARGRWMVRATVLLVAAALIAGLLAASAATNPARAAFSGANGKIAFSRSYPSGADNEIFSVSLGGVPTKLTNNTARDSRPSYSATGGKIAFDSSRADYWGDIYVMNSDGSGQKRLTRYAGLDAAPAFSPDGRKMAFQSTRGGDGNDSPTGDPDNEIWVMNSDGSGLKRLTNNGASDGTPSWSDDGTKIVFVSRRADPDGDIYVMNSDGTSEKRLTTSAKAEYEPDLSPDGRKVAFARSDGATPQIYTMKAVPGSTPTLLTDDLQLRDEDGNLYTPHTGWSSDPAWSPDGQRIVFANARLTSEGSRYELLHMDSTPTRNEFGNREVRDVEGEGSLFDDEEKQPSWQPR